MKRIFISLWLVVVVSLLFHPHKIERRETEKPEAMEALDFWTQARSYPHADIPADRYFKAFEAAKRLPTLDNPNDAWRSIGPNNFSGRMISIALNPLNPSTVYAGAASGGLWRSRTGGLGGDWQRITTGFPVLGVNAIVIHPTDSNTIYIGTGETYRYLGSTGGIVIRTTRGSYGMGILKTTNGGATWTRSLDWSYNQQRGVQAIRLNPQNRNTILAATSEGVYRSTDAGATWTNTLGILMATDIVINPTDTTLALAVCGNFSSTGGGIYRSTNSGQSFAQVAGIAPYSGKGMLEVFSASPNVVYASLADSTTGTGSLRRTTNFGANWSLVSSQALYGVQGWYSHFVAVHPTDSNQVVRGGVNIYKSTNGGVSSTNVGGAYFDMHHYAHHPTNPNILYIVSDGGVFRSTNFGDSYQNAHTGLLSSQFYNGFSCSRTDSFVAMGQVQDHFGYRYTGALAWPGGAVDEVGWTSINQLNDFIQFAGSRGGGSISKSTDRGLSFLNSSSGITGGISCWNTPFVQSPSHPNVLYFGRSIVFKTTDGAASWRATNSGAALDGNACLSMAVAATNPDTAFAATIPHTGIGRPQMFRTTNGGLSWTNATSTLPNRYPMDIAFDPRNSRIVYAAFGGFDTTRVARSGDAGTTWTDISGTLPNVPTTAVAIDPFNSNVVYVGSDIGVYVSTNGGTTWSGFNDGLPEAVIVADLVVSPSNRSLRVATHSNGVYERKLLESATGVSERPPVVSAFSLEQNYPNPFNPTTTIRFTLARAGFVTLTVFDLQGRRVATLVRGERPIGLHTIQWTAATLSSGVYFYRLQGDNASITKKMAIAK